MNSDSSSSQRPRVSLRDLAKELGVSHVTVSLALRNHPRISEAMRRKIQETAERHGYRPDPMLAALANYRKSKSEHPITSAIAWVNSWPDPSELRKHREFDLYWQGAFSAAEKFGYRIEEFQLGKNLTPQRLHQILSTRGIRGLMLPPQKAQPDWGDFPWEEYSVVRFGRSLKYPRSHLVTADQVANTILAFEKMRERGYRRIGFVTDENDQQKSGHLFEAGYLVAQRSVDESERIPIFTAGGLPPGQQFLAMANWIRANRVDAIFTDRAEVPKVLKKAGISVPGDVGLAVTTVLDTGVDTGIDQHPEEIGRVGFLLLSSLINDGARGVPPIFRQILVEGSWVDGESLPSKAGGELVKQREKA